MRSLQASQDFWLSEDSDFTGEPRNMQGEVHSGSWNTMQNSTICRCRILKYDEKLERKEKT
jgi:hypothetical protein